VHFGASFPPALVGGRAESTWGPTGRQGRLSDCEHAHPFMPRCGLCVSSQVFYYEPRRRVCGRAQVVKDLVFNRAVLPCTSAARAPAHAAAGGPGDAEPMET